MRNVIAVMAAAVTCALAGCGANHTAAPSSDNAGPIVWKNMSLAEVMNKTYSADYDPIASPKVAASAADVVVKGRIVSVTDGRSVSLDGDAPDHYVTFAVEPERLIQEDPGRVGTLVYFELPRPDNLSPETFSSAMPVGTQVALFGYRVDETTGAVSGQYEGREPGSTLYRPDSQGLFSQSPGGAMESVLEPLGDMSRSWRKLDSLQELEIATE